MSKKIKPKTKNITSYTLVSGQVNRPILPKGKYIDIEIHLQLFFYFPHNVISFSLYKISQMTSF